MTSVFDAQHYCDTQNSVTVTYTSIIVTYTNLPFRV